MASVMRPTDLRPWFYRDVSWGETFCDAPSCFQLAVLLIDFDDESERGVPVCFDCCERMTERFLAGRVDGLPDMWEREPKHRSRPLADWEVEHRNVELWARENGYYGDDAKSNPDWDIPF